MKVYDSSVCPQWLFSTGCVGWYSQLMHRIAKLLLVGVLVVLGAPIFGVLWAQSRVVPAREEAQIKQYEHSIQKAGDVYTAMTFNIGYAAGLSNNKSVMRDQVTSEANLQDIIAIIRDVDPDIVALQEVDFASARSFFVQQLDEIATQVGFSAGAQAINWNKQYVPYPPGSLATYFGRMVSGQAVASTHEISSHERNVLTRPPNPWYRDLFYLDRLAQVVEVDLGKPVIVINAHLDDAHIPTRERQLAEVLAVYRSYAKTHPVLLMGDFNAVLTEDKKIYETDSALTQLLSEPGLREVLEHDDGAVTYRADTPDRKLDHIFYNEQFITPVAATIVGGGEDPPSDHRAVVFSFRLK